MSVSGESQAPAIAGRRMAVEVQADHRILREVPEAVLREVPLLDEGLARAP